MVSPAGRHSATLPVRSEKSQAQTAGQSWAGGRFVPRSPHVHVTTWRQRLLTAAGDGFPLVHSSGHPEGGLCAWVGDLFASP